MEKMFLRIFVTISLLMLHSNAINFIDLPDNEGRPYSQKSRNNIRVKRPAYRQLTSPKTFGLLEEVRRYFPVYSRQGPDDPSDSSASHASEKDNSLKTKISTLVQQTMHDAERKIKAMNNLKERLHNEHPYKIGFILSLIKKSRDIMNELFNVAVKHRDKWKALEELKIFELIVHTNVDTTNLVRQLVEHHVQFLNMTTSNALRKRVVLL